ncbi:MAG: aldo/keto reductase [Verrucomicrobiota bacterium]
MNRVPFGKTGLEIPPIVFGSTNLGNLFHVPSKETKREIVRQWFQHCPPPVFVDTAGKYGAGLSLEVLGRELETLGVTTDQVVINNKLGWRRVPLTGPEPTFEPGAWLGLEHDAVQDIGYDGIYRCWEEGCKLLGNYRSTLASVHDPDEYLAAASSERERENRLQDILEAYRALAELKASGEVCGIGVGSKDWTVIRELSQLVEFDWVMIANSFTLLQHPPELLAMIDSLEKDNVGIINSAVYHSGFLVGGNHFDYRPADNPTLLDWRDRFHKICHEFHLAPADACVQFAMSPPGVTSIALSSSNPARVSDNVASVHAEIPREFWAALKQEHLIEAGYPFLA